MVYANDKPIFLVCDNTVYVKKLPEIERIMPEAKTGIPYSGAKEYYILDIDDFDCVQAVASVLEELTPRPAPKKKAMQSLKIKRCDTE